MSFRVIKVGSIVSETPGTVIQTGPINATSIAVAGSPSWEVVEQPGVTITTTSLDPAPTFNLTWTRVGKQATLYWKLNTADNVALESFSSFSVTITPPDGFLPDTSVSPNMGATYFYMRTYFENTYTGVPCYAQISVAQDPSKITFKLTPAEFLWAGPNGSFKQGYFYRYDTVGTVGYVTV